MAKSHPTSVVSNHGTCAPGATSSTCCLARQGTHEVNGNFGRMFRQYGRSTSWFANRAVATANLPAGVTWENYYYIDTYAYQLSYKATAMTKGGADGILSVKLRANATVHNSPPTLMAAAPALFTAVTAARITSAMTSWDAAIQTHWTGHYKVLLGAPDCPGSYPIAFSVVEESNVNKAHIRFTVLDMQDPRTVPAWNNALTNPASPQFATAQALFSEWRSNAGKFNLGDTRGTLVFAHEYGHWMGWGDEYIEVSGTMPSPTNPTGGSVVMETRNGSNVSLRVAIRIKNPTFAFQTANGSDQQVIDITVPASNNWLMANMQAPQTHPMRYVYTIVDDFIRLYNKDHHGGKKTAYCIDIK